MSDRSSPAMTVSADNRYPGGKSQAGNAEWIIARLPCHAVYAEPFAGKAGVFRKKPPALTSLLIDSNADVVAWLRQRFTPTAEHPDLCPRSTAVIHGDGIRFIEQLGANSGEFDADALLYLDPPYLLSTRTKKRLYGEHELSPDDHLRLLTAATKCECNVAISGYPSQLYDRVLSDWDVDSHEVITRGAVTRTECLWTNYDLSAVTPSLAMEYSELAGDWRERERISRLIKRRVAEFKGRPANERRAILLALLDAEREAAALPARPSRPSRKREGEDVDARE